MPPLWAIGGVLGGLCDFGRLVVSRVVGTGLIIAGGLSCGVGPPPLGALGWWLLALCRTALAWVVVLGLGPGVWALACAPGGKSCLCPSTLWRVPGNGGAYCSLSLAALYGGASLPWSISHTPLPSGSCTQHTRRVLGACVRSSGWGHVDGPLCCTL